MSRYTQGYTQHGDYLLTIYTQRALRKPNRNREQKVCQKENGRAETQAKDAIQTDCIGGNPRDGPARDHEVEGWAAIQKGQDKLEEWASGNLRKFNNYKSKVLHLGRKNPWLPCGLELCQKGAGALGYSTQNTRSRVSCSSTTAGRWVWLLSARYITSRAPHSVLGSPRQTRWQGSWASSAQGQQGGWGVGALALWEEAGKGKALQIPTAAFNTYEMVPKHVEPGSSVVGCGRLRHTRHSLKPHVCQAIHIHRWDSQTTEQAAQTGCVVSDLGDFED